MSNTKPHVEVYATFMCPYCHRAKALLKSKGVAFDEHDVSMDSGLRAKMTQRANGRTSVPQIFIDDQHIGGSDDLAALDREGKLDALLGI